MARRRRLGVLHAFDALAVLSVIVVTLWSLHPSLLVSSSLLTGGDTGAHLVLPAFLRSQGDLFNLTPWYPGWFAGMPAYTYYFVLPDFLAVLGSYVIPFAVSFKLATVLGSVLIPVTAYAMARLFRAPRPIPAALAMATLPFLFDASFTIDGGNLFSTMAGEYAFSFSLALALLALGLLARGVRTGRGYCLSAVVLSATLAAHLLPWLFAVAMGVVLVGFELLQRRGIGDPNEDRVRGDYARPFRFAAGTGLLSLALSAWWLAPFATSQSLTNSMGYTNDDVSTLHAIFTTLGWFNATGGAAGDRWVIGLAAVALVVAFAVRSRLGMVLGTWTVLSLAAFVLDPQSAIWNERLVPFWYLGIHLLAGWLVGYLLWRWTRHQERREAFAHSEVSPYVEDSDAGDELRSWQRQWHERARNARLVNVTATVLLAGLLSTLPGLIPNWASALHLNTTGNQVDSWAQWNYSGYQGKTSWPEYHNLMETMSTVSATYGCGRAMWEYNADENRFGTPMALMLLPYWTNNCVDSMEGLFFESSPTAPYHFLNQAELSVAPSDPQVGLAYGGLDVALGVRHLQMLGVKYYIAFSPSAIAQVNHDSALRLVGETRHWPTPGVTWRIYLIRNSPLVQPLTHNPVVVAGLSSRVAWLNANAAWWLDPARFDEPLASSGPSSWLHVTSVATVPRTAPLPSVTVSRVRVASQSVRFHVSRLGVPIEIKISYFNRWRVSGASGPYRISPNLMVVVPTSHDVVLTYATTGVMTMASVVSDLAVVFISLTIFRKWRRRGSGRRRAQQ